MKSSCANQEKQNEFDLIYDGIEKNVGKLMTFTAEIDTKLRAPINEESNCG